MRCFVLLCGWFSLATICFTERKKWNCSICLSVRSWDPAKIRKLLGSSRLTISYPDSVVLDTGNVEDLTLTQSSGDCDQRRPGVSPYPHPVSSFVLSQVFPHQNIQDRTCRSEKGKGDVLSLSGFKEERLHEQINPTFTYGTPTLSYVKLSHYMRCILHFAL